MARRNRKWGGRFPFFLYDGGTKTQKDSREEAVMKEKSKGGKGKQKGATEKPQREEKDEEGEEEQVGWTVSMIR